MIDEGKRPFLKKKFKMNWKEKTRYDEINKNNVRAYIIILLGLLALFCFMLKNHALPQFFTENDRMLVKIYKKG